MLAKEAAERESERDTAVSSAHSDAAAGKDALGVGDRGVISDQDRARVDGALCSTRASMSCQHN